MSKSWAGEKELALALKELNGVHPPPASKVKNIVTIALKFPNDFKMIVYDVEKWMKKSPIGDRINAVYAIDSICRGSRNIHGSKEKDLFSNRFLTRLNEIFTLLIGISENDMVSEAYRWCI